MFGVFLKYIDICDREKQSEFTPLPEVWVWASHYETAVFDIYDPIHLQAQWIWFQRVGDPKGHIIEKYGRDFHDKGRWQLLETSYGRIPYQNYNPFDPRKQNAASNTAESVFPQNGGKR